MNIKKVKRNYKKRCFSLEITKKTYINLLSETELQNITIFIKKTEAEKKEENDIIEKFRKNNNISESEYLAIKKIFKKNSKFLISRQKKFFEFLLWIDKEINIIGLNEKTVFEKIKNLIKNYIKIIFELLIENFISEKIFVIENFQEFFIFLNYSKIFEILTQTFKLKDKNHNFVNIIKNKFKKNFSKLEIISKIFQNEKKFLLLKNFLIFQNFEKEVGKFEIFENENLRLKISLMIFFKKFYLKILENNFEEKNYQFCFKEKIGFIEYNKIDKNDFFFFLVKKIENFNFEKILEIKNMKIFYLVINFLKKIPKSFKNEKNWQKIFKIIFHLFFKKIYEKIFKKKIFYLYLKIFLFQISDSINYFFNYEEKENLNFAIKILKNILKKEKFENFEKNFKNIIFDIKEKKIKNYIKEILEKFYLFFLKSFSYKLFFYIKKIKKNKKDLKKFFKNKKNLAEKFLKIIYFFLINFSFKKKNDFNFEIILIKNLLETFFFLIKNFFGFENFFEKIFFFEEIFFFDLEKNNLELIIKKIDENFFYYISNDFFLENSEKNIKLYLNSDSLKNFIKNFEIPKKKNIFETSQNPKGVPHDFSKGGVHEKISEENFLYEILIYFLKKKKNFEILSFFYFLNLFKSNIINIHLHFFFYYIIKNSEEEIILELIEKLILLKEKKKKNLNFQIKFLRIFEKLKKFENEKKIIFFFENFSENIFFENYIELNLNLDLCFFLEKKYTFLQNQKPNLKEIHYYIKFFERIFPKKKFENKKKIFFFFDEKKMKILKF